MVLTNTTTIFMEFLRKNYEDCFCWISFFNPNDVWYKQVRNVTKSLEPLYIVTTEDVLSEVLIFYSNSGLRTRQRTVELILKQDNSIT